MKYTPVEDIVITIKAHKGKCSQQAMYGTYWCNVKEDFWQRYLPKMEAERQSYARRINSEVQPVYSQANPSQLLFVPPG